MKIKLITCYYGRLPEWIQAWLMSCKYNPEYDFLIVTDDDKSDLGELPSNVQLLYISLAGLKERFENAINQEINLERAYKLCDYKPIYGIAFKDILNGYDYWGHCDLDMLFGKLSDFISEEDLLKNDRIGDVGAFTIYKNKEEMNHLFRHPGGAFSWKEVSSSHYSYGFDEMSGMNLIMKRNPDLRWKHLRQYFDSSTRLTRLGRESLNEILTWEDGHIFYYRIHDNEYIKEEFAYVHFSGKKPHICCNLNNSNHILLTSRGFYKITEDIDFNFIQRKSDFVSEKEDKREKRHATRRKMIQFIKSDRKEQKIWLRKVLTIRYGINFNKEML